MLQSIRFVHIAIVGLLVMPVGACRMAAVPRPRRRFELCREEPSCRLERDRRAPLEGGTAGLRTFQSGHRAREAVSDG